jgi:hypothetical protein
MYLSRLKLKTELRATRELRINPYLLHQGIYRAFPDRDDGSIAWTLIKRGIPVC